MEIGKNLHSNTVPSNILIVFCDQHKSEIEPAHQASAGFHQYNDIILSYRSTVMSFKLLKELIGDQVKPRKKYGYGSYLVYWMLLL